MQLCKGGATRYTHTHNAEVCVRYMQRGKLIIHSILNTVAPQPLYDILQDTKN